jgi:hypothetical protein
MLINLDDIMIMRVYMTLIIMMMILTIIMTTIILMILFSILTLLSGPVDVIGVKG